MTRRLLAYVRPYLAAYSAAVVCMAALAATTGVEAYLVGPVMRFLVGAADAAGTTAPEALRAIFRVVPWADVSAWDRTRALVWLPVLLVTLAVVKGVAYFGQEALMGRVGHGVVADLRRDLFAQLVRLSPSFHDRHPSSDAVSRLVSDVAQAENTVTFAAAALVSNGLQALVLAGLCLSLDLEMALVAIVALPICVYPIVRFGRRLKKLGRSIQERAAHVGQRTSESLAAIRVVQGFGMEAAELTRFEVANRQHLRERLRGTSVRALSSPVMELLGAVLLGGMLVYAGHRITSADLAPDAFISFFAAAFLLYRPIKTLGQIHGQMALGLAAAERVFEILDRVPDVRDRPGAVELGRLRDAIAFEGVGLRYPTSPGEAERPPALSGISLRVRRGEVVAIVGESGGGKSSLISLLPRFYDPTEGRVCVDGHDLRDVTLASLRAQLGMVTQETFLFDDTVRANVTYGVPGASDDALRRAAEAAHALAFIDALPKGFDTPVGERGVRLSGGQRQRLAIARALLRDPPILILDEATSSLDAESEREVQRALENLMRDRTTFVVAHRLSTVRRADRIVVLEHGRIVEVGTHAELLAARGAYERLFRLQLSGAPDADAAAPPAPARGPAPPSA